ncbi:MAG TPA: condensation domain-containing protein, partial [Steroidobacteraceae bacterium]
MMPSAIVVLERLPLSANGKLDRTRLPAPELREEGERLAPRTQNEKLLCGWYAEILGIEHVGIADSFFALGGDSLSAIRLVSRARQHALALSTRDIFQCKTPQALAAVCRSLPAPASGPIASNRGSAAVDPHNSVVPLTPIIQRLLTSGGRMNGFSQSMLITVPHDSKEDALLRGLQALVDHHDALRMRLEGNQLRIAPRGAVAARDCLRLVRRVTASVNDELRAAQTRLAPRDGVLLQAVWFVPGRLLLTIHHLAVDAISWHVILEDLQAGCTSEKPTLAETGTSFQQWALLVHSDARSERRMRELDYWTSVLSGPVIPLFKGAPEGWHDAGERIGQLRATLSAAITEQLLSATPSGLRARINDLLIAAFALTIATWKRRHGRKDDAAIILDVEGHGREDVFEGADLSRTVGWFTSLYPIRIDSVSLEPGRAIKQIKEQLHKLPDNGFGFGLLRYLNSRSAPLLAAMPRAQICLNYVGRFKAGSQTDWTTAPEADALIGGSDPQMRRGYLVEINARAVESGEDGTRLIADWTWSSGMVAEEDIRELAADWFASLEALAREALREEAGRLTPADITAAHLSQLEIERLEQRYGIIEDILPLSPLQEGLLFHSGYDRQAFDPYAIQIVVELTGSHDPQTLAARAECLIQRHPNLGVAFEHEGLEHPVQIIPRRITPPWRNVDLSGLDEPERQQHWARLLADDRATRFDPTTPPLLRFALVRFSPERCRLVFTHHHLLLDGWSIPILLEELLNAAPLPNVTPYKTYLEWLARQNVEDARRAWRETLEGLSEPTKIAPAATHITATPEEITFELSDSLTSGLVRTARSHQLTMNTLVQGAWAVLLGALTGRSDVVFGTIVSGRPVEIGDSDRMVGLFINTQPVRATLDLREAIVQLLTRIQERQALLTPHQHLGLAEIQRLAGVGDLFDTLVVFENYPFDREALRRLRIASVEYGDVTHYSLCLAAVPGDRLKLRLQYRPDSLERAMAQSIGERLVRLLESVASDPQQPIGAIQILSQSEREQVLRLWNQTTHEVPRSTLSQLFEAQVQRTPRATAVLFQGYSLSYGELNQRANQLAHELIHRGIGPENIVALALPRSV